MADLSYIQATLETKIVGQDATGNNANYVGADSTGHMTVVNPSEGTTGMAVPGQSMQIGGSDGTDIRTVKTDTSGQVFVNQGTANATPWNENLAQVGGSSISLGQKLAASSLPVVTQQDNSFATANITAQDVASTSTTVANSQAFITGTPTANSAASFAVSSWNDGAIQVTGTWTGTLSIEASEDGGTTWVARNLKQSGVNYIATSFTANFQGDINTASATNIRVRATAAWTGTATILLVASVNPGAIVVSNPQLLRDGTTQSTTNTIKAASTAAVAGDTSLVTALSPNTPLPAGTNTIGAVALVDGFKTSYSAAVTDLTIAATTPTDVFTITGSATKTVRILDFQVTVTTSAAAGATALVSLIKRSAANSGGTSASVTAVPHDSNNAAATATVLSYTANPTSLGASVGAVRSALYADSVKNQSFVLDWAFGANPAQAIVLRGTTQVLALNFNSTAVTGGILSSSITWTEE